MPPTGMELPAIAASVRSWASKQPDTPMLIGLARSMTYGEGAARIGAFSTYLREECGVGPGSTVVVSALNCMEMPLTIVAVTATGARLVLFSPEMTLPLFEEHLVSERPEAAILTCPRQCAIAHEVVPQARILAIGRAIDDVDRVEDAMEAGYRHHLDGAWSSEPDAEIAVLSSGSTGKPKTIVNKASSFAYNGLQFGASLGMVSGTPVYLPVPVYHVFGIVGLYGTLLAGATSVSSPKYSPETALQLIEKTRAQVHLGVPTMFIRELDLAEKVECDLSSLRVGLVAGAGYPPMVIEEFERRWDCRILPSYGMSETAATLTLTPYDTPVERRATTAGAAIDGVELRISEEDGEILVKTPAHMLGVEREGGLLDPCLDENGWFHTGDVGSIGEDGLLTVTGRIKEMIIRGGINIFPAQIEACYAEAPEVAECCLVSYPDRELGERTCLAVVPEKGHRIDSSRLREWGRGHLEKFKIPDTIVEVDTLPLLDSGKLDRNELHRRINAGIASGEIEAYGHPCPGRTAGSR